MFCLTTCLRIQNMIFNNYLTFHMAISPKDRLPKGTESLILLIYYISDSFLEHSMYSINVGVTNLTHITEDRQ